MKQTYAYSKIILLCLLFVGSFVIKGNSQVVQNTQTIYVSATGNTDSSDGSFSSPFKTITDALAALKPGMTLQIGAGTYNERIVPTVSGTADQPIVIQGEQGAQVVIDGTGLSHPDDGLVSMDRLGYITLRGLIINNSSCYGVGVYGSNHIVIEHNTIKNTQKSGVFVSYSSWNPVTQTIDNLPGNNITVRYNTLQDIALRGTGGNVQEGISISDVNTFEVAHNTLKDVHTEGICIKDGSTIGDVHHNTLTNLDAVGIYLNHATHVNVFKNLVTASKSTGIYFATGDAATGPAVTSDNNVYQNVVVGCLDGAGMWKESPGDLTRNLVYNNVFYNNINTGVYIQSPNINGNTFQNNIIVGGRYLGFGDDSGNTNTIANNLYKVTDVGIAGLNPVLADPLFVNPAAGDFSLQSNSPAIGKASSAGLPLKNISDIGAVQYGVLADIGAPAS